jgi:hypothetical protein
VYSTKLKSRNVYWVRVSSISPTIQIVTEKVQPEDGVVHWLKRGTVVQIVRDWDVKCVLPCYPINMAVTDMGFKAHSQSVNPEDVLEIPPDQLAAIQAK